LPKRARDYFKERDASAPPFLDSLLALPAPDAKPKSIIAPKPKLLTKYSKLSKRKK